MSKNIIGIDPGSVNTGYVVVESDGGIVQILGEGVVEVDKKLPAPCRIHHILTQLVTEIESFNVTEIWTELFVPYGARKGALWNTALTGAIIYLPTTRMKEDWTSFAVHPSTWKAWYNKPFLEMLVSEWEVRRNVNERYGLDLDTSLPKHVWDALGILCYAHYGDADVKQVSPA